MCIGFILFYFLSPEVEITNYPSQGDGIVAFGDSLLEGVGATKGNSLPEQISQIIGEPIINLGVSGDTTASALARIDDVIQQKPKLVIISLGGNDLIKRVPKEKIYNNLESIVLRIQEQGAIVLLLGVSGPFKNMNEEYELLSKEYGTAYVENILDGLLGKSSLMYDAIHPNDAGYAIIAEKVTPIVLELI